MFKPLRLPALWLGLALALVASVRPAQADVAVPKSISDHMVLQRESRAPIWGTAAPGEKVSVTFRGQTQETTADADGKWRVELKGLKAGGPDELTISAKNTLKFVDILVGEVWVGSGQSNMAGTVKGYIGNDPVLKQLSEESFPQIRGCTASGGWRVSNPENNPSFSALFFPFAVRIHQSEKVPVGMMLGAVGGTPSGAWLSEKALADDAPSQQLIAKYAASYDQAVANYHEKQVPAWEKANAEAKAAGKPEIKKPNPPSKPGTANNQTPGYLFRPHIQPFVGYGIRGVLWDQGESGTAITGVDQYTLMGALIRGWRNEWGQGDFPFIYIEKPSGGGCAWDNQNPVTARGETFVPTPAKEPGKIDLTPAGNEGRYIETHVKIMTYPNVGMAISSDLGSGIHPENKSGYGSRAAMVAQGMVYNQPVEYYGPVYAGHTVEGNRVRLKFTHTGKGLAWRHGERLQGFIIAGEDRNFYWAEAEIKGDEVIVSSPHVQDPKSVRYGWANRRTWANLFNNDGLPAVTFRTDSW